MERQGCPSTARRPLRSCEGMLADHNPDVPYGAIEETSCGVVRAEKVPHTSDRGRIELRTADFMRPGDEPVVTRADRLAQSMKDLQAVIRESEARGATLRATEQPMDSSTPEEQAFLDMLADPCRGRDRSAPQAADGRHRERESPRRLQGSDGIGQRR